MYKLFFGVNFLVFIVSAFLTRGKNWQYSKRNQSTFKQRHVDANRLSISDVCQYSVVWFLLNAQVMRSSKIFLFHSGLSCWLKLLMPCRTENNVQAFRPEWCLITSSFTYDAINQKPRKMHWRWRDAVNSEKSWLSFMFSSLVNWSNLSVRRSSVWHGFVFLFLLLMISAVCDLTFHET